jgi:hypothetical protein
MIGFRSAVFCHRQAKRVPKHSVSQCLPQELPELVSNPEATRARGSDALHPHCLNPVQIPEGPWMPGAKGFHLEQAVGDAVKAFLA